MNKNKTNQIQPGNQISYQSNMQPIQQPTTKQQINQTTNQQCDHSLFTPANQTLTTALPLDEILGCDTVFYSRFGLIIAKQNV